MHFHQRNGTACGTGQTAWTIRASENPVLQAVAPGLVAHRMGGFDAGRARAAFGIPDEYTPMAMTAIGHQAPAEIPDEGTRNKELSDRVCKPLAERFFEGQ
jgi:hypothetical protein